MLNFLIIVIFISKISFHFIPGIPYELSFGIFQYGVHPYINILLCFLFGSGLLIARLVRLQQPLNRQLKLYKFLLFIIGLYLFAVTFLQILFNSSTASSSMQIGSMVLSIFTLSLYGYLLPTQLKPDVFVKLIQKWTMIFCWFCLFFLFISPSTSFLGGRYIGIFKHIPHMVSTATLAFVFTLYNFFAVNQNRLQKIINAGTLICSFFLLVLTGTRSALASLVVCVVLSLILFKSESRKNSWSLIWIKVTSVLSMTLILLFFSQDISSYAVDVFKGEKSIGYRAAQDGVSSRWDEVQRGLESFNENPWIGYGLLSKFGETEDGDVGRYNANKDPHNIFVSAGVIGGWGFIVVIMMSYVGLIILCLNRLKSKDKAIQMMAIYMCSQLPILFIYHMHLSIGGIADRIYWLVIGFLAIKNKNE